ncbi:MAG: hypothetical protein Q8R60_17500 [Mycobacteriales bacterium]|nr:hypothetical protein [Mycobacteriales bacterium]
MTRLTTRATTSLAAALALAALGALAVPGSAAPPTGAPGPGYIATSNVTHVLTVPLDTDIAGGRLVGKDFFVRTAKGITVYDATNPALPTPKGFVAVPATPNQEREDIDTNGKILVTGQSYDGILYVVDIRNRTAPTILSVLPGAAGHTNTCVLDCTFVYSSEGDIVDLRDPAAPKLLPQKWNRVSGARTGHDLTEVRPGFLVAASNPVAYLDARNPVAPTLLASGVVPDNLYVHGTAWPRAGKDRFILAGTETGVGCQGELGTFNVFDTKNIKKKALTRIGGYALERGLPTDLKGQAPVAQHCGHWFDVHPSFKDGGLVAMAWYTSGVRFLGVSSKGVVEERGFWQPLPGQSSAVYWVSPDTVWVTDYTARAIDVLRFDTKAPAEKDAALPGRFYPAGTGPVTTHAADHHSVAALADKWVCRPAGAVAPLGRPTAA